jgi:hypothetical protein
MSLFLWHGKKQGLVARRTALRQAESLKGHGFSVGKSIVGRDIKTIKEIDDRKVGREPNTTELNEELQKILNKEYKELDDYIITFQTKEIDVTAGTPKRKTIEASTPTPKPEATPVKTLASQPKPKTESTTSKLPTHQIKPEMPSEEKKESIQPMKSQAKKETVIDKNLEIEAKVGFVLIAILQHFDDIWVSKKEGGAIAVEYMEGPICEFQIKNGKINFSSNSFTGISTNIKTEIKKKFVELNNLLIS